jgi:biopolymer transport protein TolR
MSMMLGANKNNKGRRALMSEINVTPFVDVMLVLLIIFMITAPMLVSGIKIDLPEAQTQSLNSDNEPLTITINNKGEIFIIDSQIAKEELAAKLIAITNAKFGTRIFIRGDKKIPYGDMVNLINQITAAGFNQVALVTTIKTNDK